MITIDNQRLRNLTTGRLHTCIDHVYADIETLVGSKGIMTHQIPAAIRALRSWLKQRVTDGRFWNEAFDQSHKGCTEIVPMSAADRLSFFIGAEIDLTGGTP